MATEFKKMDFFQHKLLAGKDARFYVRGGSSFMYVGSDRFDFEPPSEEDRILQIGHINAGPMDISKEVVLDGFIWLWQNEEHYALVFFDTSRSHAPIALKFGNALLDS